MAQGDFPFLFRAPEYAKGMGGSQGTFHVRQMPKIDCDTPIIPLVTIPLDIADRRKVQAQPISSKNIEGRGIHTGQ